ncbi:hypothetical protein GOP47_0016423 [Adiantum capillus-veneris]|uniref:Uncharacterized protein n=1 Tax=Adiantum capillus-veneris TaxID=13818 RepID=A0A9D4ZA96_ADICA|nr:hypothetical protein GOP47_0016423 [Adiantum capillus-veneris]
MASSSASSSNKPRSNSPFRFFKSSSAAAQQGSNVPGLTQVLEPTDSSSSSQSLNLGSKSQSMVNRAFAAVQKGNRASGSPPQMMGKLSSTSSISSACSIVPPSFDGRGDFGAKPKESVAVTIRFRPLSTREMQKGDEVAWFPDSDTIVRCEYNNQTAYAFDKVFGPVTTTRQVYDSAARLVVRGAMQGVNGTVFAYGVTSSGKTHTMHGDQKSPGIIPLAIKDVFSFIQDTPGREYLLRVSYLEIYNEVINDLLNPTRQNLRIREDAQGTYVEGVKEEVVLSPAHALSLIAAGEEHRHVGSNNFNLFSSRSHTIFTLTIESSSHTPDVDDDDVTLSLLNLIDLAGSESSKTETTGIRRKEGSYINKSLLTLGTVIAKLSDGKPAHVPFRDSKLTRLLQSSLSGQGRVSLICTITPASSYFEETHNTLKFAHRAKHVEIHTSSNKIMDEKSLIKKYQKEIVSLKEELDLLKRDMIDKGQVLSVGDGQEDILNLRQQLEAGQVKMQSRLEEEEQAKSALLGRIQRLTKLILVSSKSSVPNPVPEVQPRHRRRYSFGEEERSERLENLMGSSAVSLQLDRSQSSSSGSVLSMDKSLDTLSEMKGQKKPMCSRVKDHSVVKNASQGTQAGELFSATGRRPVPTGETMADQLDLLREQIKMLAGEVAFRSSSLKRMLEQAAGNPDDSNLQVQIQKVKDEIQEKKSRIAVLEKRIVGAGEAAFHNANPSEMSQNVMKLMNQLNELTFELEIKSADNRVLQEQLQVKIAENNELQEVTRCLREQLAAMTMERSQRKTKSYVSSCKEGELIELEQSEGWSSSLGLPVELKHMDGSLDDDMFELRSNGPKGGIIKVVVDSSLQSQVISQATEIEKLKQENMELMEEKAGLQIHAQKLTDEAVYARQLASAAAVELRNLAEEVTKLSYQNAKLQKGLTAVQDLACTRVLTKPAVSDLQREFHARSEREAGLEAALADKENMEVRLQWKLEEAKQKEAELENDLAGMWMLISKLSNNGDNFREVHKKDEFDIDNGFRIPAAEKDINVDVSHAKINKTEKEKIMDDLKAGLESERRRSKEMELIVSQLKSEELSGLNVAALEDLQNLHVEALTRLCQAKAKMQQKIEKEHDIMGSLETHDEERSGHICKVCFEAPTAAVLLPCRHFCLCKACAVACTECPLCRSGISDRIITFTS